jgi:hypothetical protein
VILLVLLAVLITAAICFGMAVVPSSVVARGRRSEFVTAMTLLLVALVMAIPSMAWCLTFPVALIAFPVSMGLFWITRRPRDS